jgi:hypothetical protein
MQMRISRIVAALAAGAMLAGAGCKKNVIDKMEFKSAIDNYSASKPQCVWAAAVKFPAQADAKNDEQTKGFDALTDAGMLTRKPEEKKRFLIGSKPVNDYDLSDKGRAAWTADATQPGYGNFCYGHPEVTTIDSFTPADNPDATQFTVNYHDAVKNVPDWANTAEMKTAFPKIDADTAGTQTATANVSKGSNGWEVTSVTPAAAAPATTAP